MVVIPAYKNEENDGKNTDDINIKFNNDILELNVPQGSILGPDAYAHFTKPVRDMTQANIYNML